jgi:hypothetical protein
MLQEASLLGLQQPQLTLRPKLLPLQVPRELGVADERHLGTFHKDAVDEEKKNKIELLEERVNFSVVNVTVWFVGLKETASQYVRCCSPPPPPHPNLRLDTWLWSQFSRRQPFLILD